MLQQQDSNQPKPDAKPASNGGVTWDQILNPITVYIALFLANVVMVLRS